MTNSTAIFNHSTNKTWVKSSSIAKNSNTELDDDRYLNDLKEKPKTILKIKQVNN